MRWPASLAVTVALGLSTLVVAPSEAAAGVAHRADGQFADWVGNPTMLGGRTTVDLGELIYDDYLYDDYGPNLDQAPNLAPFVTLLSSTNGDYRYPDGESYGYNAADLRQLRIAATGTTLHLAVFFQTLKTLDTTIAMIAIDTDGDSSTDAAQWPDGVGLATPGADRFITVTGDGAWVSDGAQQRSALVSAADLDENAYEVDVPLDELGPVSDDAKVWVVTGLADGHRFRAGEQGATAAFDIGFQGAEDTGVIPMPSAANPNLRYLDEWNDRRQADALAAGDLTAFSHPLHLAALRSRASIPFELTPGFYNRIFRSRYDHGEGVTVTSEMRAPGDVIFKSRYQPYGLYVPESYHESGPSGLLLTGHSAFSSMNQYAAISPNWLTQLGDGRDSLVVTPLARSPLGLYEEFELADVLEAQSDALTGLDVDPDRVDIAGIAAGGILTYRLGLRMPDAYQRASVHLGLPKNAVGPVAEPGDVNGDSTLLVGNALNLPFELNYSTSAPLVNIVDARAMEQRFIEEGNAYRFYDNPAAVEPFNLFYQDWWGHTREWLGTKTIDRAPVRVRYVRYPVNDLEDFGVRFDHAYWVRDLVVRDESAVVTAHGEIDAMTYALGGYLRRAIAEEPHTEDTPNGLEVVTGQRHVDGAPILRRNGFRATLTTIGSVRFLTAQMGLDPAKPMTATLIGDGPTTLRFDGTWPQGVRATVDGVPVPVIRDGHGIRLTVALPAGAPHTLVVK